MHLAVGDSRTAHRIEESILNQLTNLCQIIREGQKRAHWSFDDIFIGRHPIVFLASIMSDYPMLAAYFDPTTPRLHIIDNCN
jgi:hypothetical protein